MTKKELLKLEKLMTQYLQPLALGGIQICNVLKDAGHQVTSSYECEIATEYGTLRVNYHDWTLHCRFLSADSIAAAKADGVDCNPYSGKYNTYVFARVSANEGFGILKQHLLAVL